LIDRPLYLSLALARSRRRSVVLYREGGEKRNTGVEDFSGFRYVALLRCRRGSSSRRRRLSIPTRLCCFPQAIGRTQAARRLSAALLLSFALLPSTAHHSISALRVCVCVCVRVLCPSLHPSLLSSQPPSSNHCTMALAFRTAIFRATRMVVAPGARFASTEHRTCLSLARSRCSSRSSTLPTRSRCAPLLLNAPVLEQSLLHSSARW